MKSLDVVTLEAMSSRDLSDELRKVLVVVEVYIIDDVII